MNYTSKQITLTEIKHKETTYFITPTVFEIEILNGCKYLFASEDLSIIATGESEEEVLKEIAEQFDYNYRNGLTKLVKEVKIGSKRTD
jgi:hypothetical protein